uniref:Uncharacterized protein n=1 Tax=Populus trichocarpa TaxID=3694 RepID=U5FK37_POPTR
MIMTHKEAGHDDEEDDFLKTRARVELRVAEDFLACLQARRVIHRTKLRNTPHGWDPDGLADGILKRHFLSSVLGP